MKKNYLFYLFVMIGSGLLFTSCGKDDPDPDPAKIVTWKDALGSYGAEGTLKLTINEEAPATDSKTLTLAAGTGENAKITLTHIVPDEAKLEIDNVTMVKDGDNTYTFSAEASVGLTTVAVAGSLSGIAEETKTLDLKVSRKINSPMTGAWKLDLSLTAEGTLHLVHVYVKTADAAVDEKLNVLSQVLGRLLKQSVADVTVKLGEDGLIDVNWTTIGESSPIPDLLKQLLSIQYFMLDGKIYLAIDKSLLPLLEAVPLPEGSAINLNAILSALTEDRGGFLVFPLNMSLNMFLSTDAVASAVTFFVGKDVVQILLPLVAPSLLGALPEAGEDLLYLIQQLPEIVAGAETFDVGLNFVRTDAL